MDYKELTENLKGILPEKVLYGDLIGAEGIYAHSGPMVYEDPEPYFIEQAIAAIFNLLSRAETAEKCINAIEDDLDRGNDNDWAREHIREYRTERKTEEEAQWQS